MKYNPEPDLEHIDNCHAAYEDILKATVEVFRKRGILIDKHALECIMEEVGEALSPEAQSAIERAYQNGFYDGTYTPDNCEKQIDDAYEGLLNKFRPKQLDVKAVLESALRPFPTNPATPGFPGGEAA